MIDSRIAQAGKQREPRLRAEAVVTPPCGGEYLPDGPSAVLVPPFSSPQPEQAEILLL